MRYADVIRMERPLPQPVEMPKPSPVVVEPASTVDVAPASTGDDDSPSTADAAPTSTGDARSASTVLWQAENGALFPGSRVRRVARAQDALTHIEESVYNFLWGAKTNGDAYRLTEAGYAEIHQASRIAKRNVPEVIERLIGKGFVKIERQADIWTRKPTQYRVLGYRAALDELDRTGRRWTVKSGNGVLFVRRLEMRPTGDAGQPSTVDAGQRSTVDAGHQSTVDAGSTSTVDAASTHRGSKNEEEKRGTSSSLRTVAERLRRHITIDDDGVRQIVASCHAERADATGEEIAHFAEQLIYRHRHNRKIDNLNGLLIRGAVAKYFEWPATDLVKMREAAAEERQRQEERARGILTNPNAEGLELEWAKETLAAGAGK